MSDPELSLVPTALAEQHNYFMQLALTQAQRAYDLGEVPVGAVIVDQNNQFVASGFNQTIRFNDPTAHAEIVALRQAAQVLNNYRLPNLRLYVTLEPCTMCIGALLHARIGQIIYGAADPKTGACGSVLALHAQTALNHQTTVSSGVLAQACSRILRQFFRERRQGHKNDCSCP